ncbi:MAG TPA: 4-coumarate--CoA ligase family protein [Chloroflexia bacterium]|nr:4-coumarate--CoA ligase family protein [Chloroflexia bacterium]
MIFTSPYAPVTIPEQSLTEVVLAQAQQRGDKPALIDGPTGRTITYRQLAAGIRRVAAGLAARGFGKGDVLAIYSPNIPEYPIAFHAVASLGGITTTINPLYTVDELVYQLKDAGARYLITAPAFMDKARDAAAQVGLAEVFVFGEAPGATPFADLLTSAGEPPAVAIHPRDDLVALPYSSGTTGLAKGVMLTHYNLVANMTQIDEAIPLTADDILIGILPFYHIYALELILNRAIARGTTIVVMPRFDLEQFLRLIQDYGVTHAFVAPPIVLALAKQPVVEQFDLSKLRLVMSGAAPLGADVAQACADRLHCTVKQAYGLTESSPATHINPADPARIKLASVGPLIANTEGKVLDPATDAELGPNEIGEICVRGPQVMKGYLNRPEATAAMIDPDGWMHTGDLGYADAEGYFYVVDRMKELIKYKGMQVAPAELEALLLTHPDVVDAAVIPKPDEEAGEIPKAFVVLRGAADLDAICAYVAARVAPHKRIRAIEAIDQIPKTASGKILRRVLVARERGGS